MEGCAPTESVRAADTSYSRDGDSKRTVRGGGHPSSVKLTTGYGEGHGAGPGGMSTKIKVRFGCDCGNERVGEGLVAGTLVSDDGLREDA